VAIYHDCLTALDRQVGELLDELADNGLADDTIVFYYSDHGGPTPRGKRYLYDTGVRVPLLVHIPKKWRTLTPFARPQKVDELVSFVDLAPTLLALAGIDPPEHMQGRAFLGARRVAPAEVPAVFLYADRFDEIEGMDRGLTDGRYKFIRHFTPHLPAAPKSYYSLGAPSWAAWQQAWREDRLPPASRGLWEAPQPVEEFYDLERDPWEVDNLADDPAHADRLAEFRRRLFDEMLAVRDTSVIPEAMFRELAENQTLYEYARSPQCNYEQLLRVAVLATERDPANLPALLRDLGDGDAVVRYWATLGALNLGPAAAAAEPQLVALLNHPNACLRITAATALDRIGQPEAAKATLLAEFERQLSPKETLHLINAVVYLGCEAEVPQLWVDEHAGREGRDEYVLRFANRLAERRSQRRAAAP
jgi:N-sulfoglucosamine sulfohydrolase